jgi:thermitase
MLQHVLRIALIAALLVSIAPPQRAAAAPATAPSPAPVAAPTDFPPPPVLEPKHAPVHGQARLDEPWVEGEILVQIKENVAIDRLLAKHKLPGVAKRYIDVADTPANRATGALRWFRVPVTKGQEGAIVVELARNVADVAYVQLIPQKEPTVAGAPNDQCYNTGATGCPISTRQQPYMNFIKMPRAWDRTHATSNPPAIALVDSGVQSSHPDLQGKLLAGWDYSNGVGGVSIPAGTGTDSGCAGGHGTGTSSIAAASTNNTTGMAGTGWDAKIIPIKYINSACGAYGGTSVAAALYKARDLGAKVVNLSLMESRTYQQATQDAINNLTLVYGILIVVAAGNNNCELSSSLGQYQYPCAYANVLCVGGSQTTSATRWSTTSSCDLNNNPFWGSNYGGEFVYVSAPAVSVVNATAAGGYAATNGGTSYAAPLVSGIGALLVASGCRPLEARQAITDTAQANDGWTRYGPVNGAGALTRRCAPGTSAWANGNRIDIIALGKDDKVHQMFWDNINGWRGWDLPGFPVSRPAAGAGSSPYILWSQFDGAGVGHRLDVWVEGFDLNLYQMTWCDSQGIGCPAGANWSGWNVVGGPPAASTPAIAGKRSNVSANIRQDLFTRPWNTSVFYQQPWTTAGYFGWKTAPGGPLAGSKSEPSASWWGASDNLLDLFVLGDDGHLYQNFLTGSSPSAPSWSGWSDRGTAPGGLLTSSPYVAGSPTATHLDALALAANGLVYQTFWTGAAWSWNQVGSGQPAAASGPTTTWRGGTQLEAFLISSNGGIYQSTYSANSWTSWGFRFNAP